MRYLRMLSNSFIAGVLGAAYLTVLILQLNPHVPGDLASLWPLFSRLFLAYGVHLTVIFYAVIVLRQFLSTTSHSPGWVSVRLLSWLVGGTAGLTAVLTWINVWEFGATLGEAARAMSIGAAIVTASAVALLGLAVALGSLGRRGGAVGAAALVLVTIVSLALPLSTRIRHASEGLPVGFDPVGGAAIPGLPRVLMLLLDGASFDYIATAVTEGRLPNFGMILDTGAAMHLRTLRPTQPGPVWTAVATGKYPAKNGVKADATYQVPGSDYPVELLPSHCLMPGLVRLGLLKEMPNTSSSLRARPMWSILNGLGISVGVIGWPLTYPVQPVQGYLVSERFHLFAQSPLSVEDDAVAYPEAVVGAVFAGGEHSVSEDQTLQAVFAAPSTGGLPVVRVPSARDRFYRRIARQLKQQYEPRVVAVRYQGLDEVGHWFLRFAMPRVFGDVSEAERQRHGRVLEESYAFIDAEVGEAIESLGSEDLLLVVSGFGMEPVGLGTRALARALSRPELSGTHDGAPDGFMLAYGSSVAAGRLPVGAIVDVVPTIFYFLGLPVARDMDGFPRGDVFSRTFTAERPITSIPSYDR